MNKRECKSKLSEIIVQLHDVKEDLISAKSKEKKLLDKLDEVNELIEDYGLGEGVVDLDEVQNDIVIALVENTEFNELSGEISDFQQEVTSYIEELPEEKADDLQDEFSNFLDYAFLEQPEEESLDLYIEKLDEAIIKFKEQLEKA